MRGVDVSSYQGEIDWSLLNGQKIHFAFIKATEGSSHLDSTFHKNWDGANATPMKVGAYHFFSFDSPGDSQAENFIHNVPLKEGTLPPVVDVEFYGGNERNPPDPTMVRSELRTMLDRLETHYECKPILYATGQSYELYLQGNFDDYLLWIRDVLKMPNLPDGRKWDFWQYSNRGRLKGYTGSKKYIDLNVFQGTMNQLEALCQSAPAGPTPSTIPDVASVIETAPTPKMNDANAEIPFPMLPDQYVTCFSWLGPVEHEELWSEWLACYLEGKPAQVTIEVILSPVSAIYRLTADGSERYQVECYVYGEYKTASMVGVSEYPLYYSIGFAGQHRSAFLTKSTPVGQNEWNGIPFLPSSGSNSPAQPLDVDCASFPTLGVITPTQALEIVRNNERLAYINDGKPQRLELVGAFLLAGHPFYAIANRADADFSDIATLAVNADGGDILLQIELEWGYWCTIEDGQETVLLPDNFSEHSSNSSVPYQK